MAVGIIILGFIASLIIGFPLMALVMLVMSKVSLLLTKLFISVGVSKWLISLVCGAVVTAITFAFQMASYVFGISLRHLP